MKAVVRAAYEPPEILQLKEVERSIPRDTEVQVQELRIQTDEAKKAREVAEITETDYFRDLCAKAQRLRQRRGE